MNHRADEWFAMAKEFRAQKRFWALIWKRTKNRDLITAAKYARRIEMMCLSRGILAKANIL